MYFAPYREEHKPSFRVNAEKNVFYDFGTGTGGDIFRLAGEFCHSSEFMQQAKFIADSMNVQLPMKEYPKFSFSQQEEHPFENVIVSHLKSPTLLRYLENRGISKEIATQFCVQVDYRLHEKDYYAVGFENQTKGYELINQFFKGSIQPKNITHLQHDNPRCNVYEGFIDFLSAEKLGYNDGNDAIILNSVANVNKAIQPLADYSVINCYLDNDAAGRTTLARLRREFGDKVTDKSALYPDHKDLNEYLVAISPKKSNKIKL